VFGKNEKDKLIEQQQDLLGVQNDTLKNQAARIDELLALRRIDAAKLETALQGLASCESRIARLQSYCEDLGLDLKAVEAAEGIWRSRASDVIVVSLDAAKLATDPRLNSAELRSYVECTAKSFLGKAA
jgi:signal transduction histidine kinase